ncbi:FAD binding domain-containing protein [Xylariaceae sp. FL1651]|nr:FAD binding domain-containing protein [Xylariaceae sp. FL1651]
MTPQDVDVLIIGGGSAGICAGVWLARSGISYRILERRPGKLENGQADGVQVRTVEVFESFGISEELLKEAYHVLEDTFWSPASSDGREGEVGGQEKGTGIRRTHSAPDTEAGLSHLPHVILNQARVNALLTDEMERASGATNIIYGCEFRDLKIDKSRVDDPDAHCVTVTAVKDGAEQVYRAKYVLGSDGAHSQVRKALGINMVGESSDEVWGVMDVYPRTDFPDIRKKVIIKSESGNVVIIPREGDSLVRLYIELSGGGAAAKDVTLAQLHEKARLIFRPYTMDIAETAWWSAYVIGQRLADAFHAEHRVFLGGDACHTHSPKAGQGMNVSLQDGNNLGWKVCEPLTQKPLAAVLQKRASPELLKTYVLERHKTAADLIDFDRYWSKLFSTADKQGGGITPELFIKAGRYTAGLVTRYEDSVITAAAESETSLAANLTVGMRFPSVQVVRLCDARHLQLTRALPANSRWHLVLFGGDIINDENAAKRLQNVAMGLEGIVRAFTPSGSDIDSVLSIVLVLSSQRSNVKLEEIPEVFTPVTGKWKMKNILKVFVDDEGLNNSGFGHAYEVYGIDPSRGALVVVRPDQYIARISSLEDVSSVESFLMGFLKK